MCPGAQGQHLCLAKVELFAPQPPVITSHRKNWVNRTGWPTLPHTTSWDLCVCSLLCFTCFPRDPGLGSATAVGRPYPGSSSSQRNQGASISLLSAHWQPLGLHAEPGSSHCVGLRCADSQLSFPATGPVFTALILSQNPFPTRFLRGQEWSMAVNS